jgi:hypothetical protein
MNQSRPDSSRQISFLESSTIRLTPQFRQQFLKRLATEERVPNAYRAETPIVQTTHECGQSNERSFDHIRNSPNILEDLVRDVNALGLTGEDLAAQLVFLGMCSRWFKRPISMSLKGPSSAGKSFTVATVLKFFPRDAYHDLTAMSDKALAYSDVDLRNKFLVLYEAAGMKGNTAEYLIRSLLSEGCVKYETVDSTKDGQKPKLIVRDGPTGLLTTTTRLSLHPENETRLLSVPINDTQEQTRNVMLKLAEDQSGRGVEVNVPAWHEFQKWLGITQPNVSIPFASTLAQLVSPLAVRMRRDFGLLLTLISTHAFIHQASRSRDEAERIVATPEDYRQVYRLVATLLAEGVKASVQPIVRETVKAVAALQTEYPQGVPLGAVAKALSLDDGAASRRVNAAKKIGYLEDLETVKGRTAKIVISEPMPDDVEVLPKPELLEQTVAQLQ